MNDIELRTVMDLMSVTLVRGSLAKSLHVGGGRGGGLKIQGGCNSTLLHTK